MKSKPNLTRFTYETTAFQGWRLCVGRKGTVFTKYFSDKKHGGPIKAKRAAERKLVEVKQILDNNPLRLGKLSIRTIHMIKLILA